MDANKYRTAYDKAQAVQHEVWTELCQHLEHAPDAQLLSDYTATLVYTLDKDRREEALRLLRGQLYSRQLRDTGRVESWFTDCGARMGQDIEGFVANARQQYVQAGLAEEQRAEAEAKQKAGRGRFRIRPASAFAPERAAYLVQPYLPRGMVSILGGVSAAGKTSLALDVCARLTRGAAFAPDTPPQPPATVLYLTAENDPNKVLRPRAEAMGADLDRLYFQDGASYSMGDEELAALCRVYRPALLVFDPIQSYLGQGVQMNRAEQVRPLLDHLGALAKELDMAVLLISHMSKPGPGVCSALDRLLGSSDFRNAARSILIAGRDPEHPEVRVVAHAKNSLGQPGESQRYRICPQGTVAYDGPCTLTADAIIREAGTPATGNGRPSAALANAIEALEKQLSFVGCRGGRGVPPVRRAGYLGKHHTPRPRSTGVENTLHWKSAQPQKLLVSARTGRSLCGCGYHKPEPANTAGLMHRRASECSKPLYKTLLLLWTFEQLELFNVSMLIPSCSR